MNTLLCVYGSTTLKKGDSCPFSLDAFTDKNTAQLDHLVIFYGYMLQSMDCTCMSTFSIRPFLFEFYSFEWLMLQSMELHALLPSLLRGLLGLPLFPTSAFYFYSSNKPFYLKHFLHLKVFYLQQMTWREI